MGLMAIHLILRALVETARELSGNIRIYSDCKGALSKVRWLSKQRVSASNKHADILKIILHARATVADVCTYKHVAAHQDNALGFYVLGRAAQLNCLMDAAAKQTLSDSLTGRTERQRHFPTKTISCFVGNQKVTSKTRGDIKFWSHRRLARESLCTPTKHTASILMTAQFDEIAWEFVTRALTNVPRMFQLWASKQVWERVTEIFKYILWVNYDESKIALPASSGHRPEGAIPVRHKNLRK